jgi:hypothetical protein
MIVQREVLWRNTEEKVSRLRSIPGTPAPEMKDEQIFKITCTEQPYNTAEICTSTILKGKVS